MTIVIFKLTDPNFEERILRDGILINKQKKMIRKYIDKKKLVIRCFRCNKLNHTTNNCKERTKRCPRCNKTNCEMKCNKRDWKCVNCGGEHSAAYEGCPKYKEILRTKQEENKKLSYADALKRILKS